MTSICSPVKSINNLIINRTKVGSRSVSCEKVVSVNKITVIKLSNGQIYAPFLGNYAYGCSMWRWTNDMLKALVSLGVVTQAEADLHVDCASMASEISDIEYEIKDLNKLKEKHKNLPIKSVVADLRKKSNSLQSRRNKLLKSISIQNDEKFISNEIV
jgi:hypothetical protein